MEKGKREKGKREKGKREEGRGKREKGKGKKERRNAIYIPVRERRCVLVDCLTAAGALGCMAIVAVSRPEPGRVVE